MAASSDLSSIDGLSTPPRSPPDVESVTVAPAYGAPGASSATQVPAGALTTFPVEGERKKRKYVRKIKPEEKPATESDSKVKKTRKPRAPK